MLRVTLMSVAALAWLGSSAWGQGHAAGGHAGGASVSSVIGGIPGLNYGTGGAVTTSNGWGAVSGGFAYNPTYGLNGMLGGYGTNPWGGGYGTNGYGMGGYQYGGYPYGGYNAGFGFAGNQFNRLPVSNGGTVGATRGNANVAAMMNGAIPTGAKNAPRAATRTKSAKRKKR